MSTRSILLLGGGVVVAAVCFLFYRSYALKADLGDPDYRTLAIEAVSRLAHDNHMGITKVSIVSIRPHGTYQLVKLRLTTDQESYIVLARMRRTLWRLDGFKVIDQKPLGS